MRVVMTGGTAGIGLEAVRAIAAKGPDLTVGARGKADASQRAGAAVEALDLADLTSAARFADRIAAGPLIDRLLLNAGTQTVTGARSAQGLELTFAANHLAHFLILRRLLPRLAPGARVILTASGTHDPEERTGMPPPLHADAFKLAYPERDADRDGDPAKAGRRAYSSSKLCNVMTVREVARRLAVDRPDVATAAFDPGFTPGTGLARDYPAWQNFLFRNVLRFVVRGEGVSTPPVSGRCLAAMATEPAYASARGDYFAVRRHRLTPKQPSAVARDPVACETLWTDSEALLTSLGF